MSKKYLYCIIIFLLLIIFGFISVPSFNMGHCENGSSSKVYLRFGFFSIPLPIERCDKSDIQYCSFNGNC